MSVALRRLSGMKVTSPGNRNLFIAVRIFVPVSSVSTMWWNNLQHTMSPSICSKSTEKIRITVVRAHWQPFAHTCMYLLLTKLIYTILHTNVLAVTGCILKQTCYKLLKWSGRSFQVELHVQVIVIPGASRYSVPVQNSFLFSRYTFNAI